MTFTARQALALEQRYGGGYCGDVLEWVEVTTFNSQERLYLLATPRCPYCGQPAPRPQCQSCGAGALRDGETVPNR